MEKFKQILLLGSCLLTFACSKTETSYVEKENFNSNWSFKLIAESDSENTFFNTAVDVKDWEEVQVPHTPRLEPKVVNDQWQGVCWYRKNFTLSKDMKGKHLSIKFEGAMNIAEVWVNGVKLITHHGGYLPFVVDFTELAVFKGNNTIAVRLDNRDNPVTGPKPLKILDFNTYGGIHRNVWLIAKNALHITDPIAENITASGGIFVSYPEVSEAMAKVRVKTHVKNELDKNTSFSIKNTLYLGDSIAHTHTDENVFLDAKSSKEIVSELCVVTPSLWSTKTPHLYRLKTEILQSGIVVDQEVTTIGIKTMKFVGQDFYLNGQKTFLRGVNRHQEYPHIGYALSDNANYRDAKKIKEAGFDYVRLSHYPQAPSFMDACDELGLITIDAILGWQYFSEDKNFQKHVFQTAKDLIRRDRNHASVLAWEVSLNESWMPEDFIDSLHAIAHQEYPGDQCFSAGWQSYGYDIYLQARQHRLSHYDEDLKKPYNVSEYGDWEYYAMNAGLNQNSWGGLLQADRSSRQLRTASESRLLQQATNLQESHNDNLSIPAFSDGYWVMFDYNRGYAADLESSGIMDIFRLPKPAYYFYKSQRDSDDPFGEPMVHIANQWQKGSPLDIRVFSNCDEVALFLNGKSIGRQKPDKNRISNNLNHPPFTFKTSKFKPGNLVAKAFINGKEVVNHKVFTPQKASRIELINDLSGRELEGDDVVFVYAKVTDENGTVIPDYSGEIVFKITGGAELIGENPVACEAGIASILIKTNHRTKELEISATVIDSKLEGVLKIK